MITKLWNYRQIEMKTKGKEGFMEEKNNQNKK